jgi:serine/threonine protein kinase
MTANKGIYEALGDAGGTRLFMAPEQVHSAVYGKPVDIWACGIIMYYLLSFARHPI